ncbi:MAG: DUF4160 domain-containing protein, partial [Planctomycetota bacterium]
FFSNEGDEPPHIHVETAGKYAKFWLIPVNLVQSIGYNAKELTLLRSLVEKNCKLFKEKWNEYFEG